MTVEDATKFVLGEDVALPEDSEAEEIQVHYTRIAKIENLEKFRVLRKLVLVATGLKEIENLENQEQLEHLEIYQGSIACIRNISHLSRLTVLDLSFNKITKIEGLNSLVNLEKLYLSSNDISVIENIDKLTKLKVLELGSNFISSIEGIENLEELEELWLGRNRISSMRLPSTFEKLRILSLQSNRVDEWSELWSAPNLEQLYLSSNKLTDPSDDVVASLPTTLTDLDIAHNLLTRLPRFEAVDGNKLGNLTDLWLNNNLITDFDSLDNLRAAPALETVYLEKNRVQSQVPLEYTKRMRVLCPRLKQLDAVPIIALSVTEDSHRSDVRSILRH